ncbi:sigma-70 family RNA polymerase sigma factor [Peterkaempfera bronchialis]|uniref:RNA polymerase sigma factor n=1 Tax=Peterkaempfera bronchialis TaxID=2126346 RepID=A0A345T0M1_9ACTN|nr:sigma-70 family RNA polymerase sigma factor [Peterkaempfera bronchialis]AXI79526.1 RNA polymerase subunit sigma-24 [Peterkaempfera bronchialis]
MQQTITATTTAHSDSEWVRALYARYGRSVLGHVLRLLHGDYQRAEDLVQETFLRAWQHRATLDPERAGPWLHTVAHNLVVSAFRRTQARPQESPLGEEEPPGRGEDELDRMLESWQMAEALRGLRPDHRAVLIQVYYLRRTVAEAAQHLGIPAGTVKSRCYYALRALRNVLEERGVTAP